MLVYHTMTQYPNPIYICATWYMTVTKCYSENIWTMCTCKIANGNQWIDKTSNIKIL